jgi:hypothetical protein
MIEAAPSIVAELHPPRLPAEFIATGWQDVLAAFGLGLLLAALVLAVLGPLLRPRPRRESHAARLARLEALPPSERLLGQLALLRERGTPLPDDLRAALYGPTPLDPGRLDALVRGRR